jgi:hypothetical protein
MKGLLVGLVLLTGMAVAGTRALELSHESEQIRTPTANISAVARVLERAAAQGEQARKQLNEGRPSRRETRWLASMNAACAVRNRRSARLARPRTLTEAAGFADEWLRLERRRQLTVRALRPPARFERAAARITRMDAQRERDLETVAQRARSGDASATLAAISPLRELAGSVNPMLVRIGLAMCAYSASGLPR